MLKIKQYPAGNGDSFLLVADLPRPTAILVDGGYPATFSNHIRADLEELSHAGHALNVLVVTHIDADHVSGLLPFFSGNGSAADPKIISVQKVLHNSLRSLAPLAKNSPAPARADKELLAEIQQVGCPPPAAEAQADGEISARQGSSLAALLKSGGYAWNEGEGISCVSGDGFPSFPIGGGRLTVIGPPRARLEALREWWVSEMRGLGYAGTLDANDQLDDAFEFLCAARKRADDAHTISGRSKAALELKDCYLPDDSVPNGSSIALILEIGKRRVLFLGDAWAEDVVTALTVVANGKAKLLFDAIKVSHHGSVRNTSPALLGLIDAPRYFVSSNGDGHDHPDLPVLKAIVDRPGPTREMYFSYSTPASGELKTHRSAAATPFVVHEGVAGWIEIGD